MHSLIQWLFICKHANVSQIFNNSQRCFDCGKVRGYWWNFGQQFEPMVGRWVIERTRFGNMPIKKDLEYPIGWNDDRERIYLDAMQEHDKEISELRKLYDQS